MEENEKKNVQIKDKGLILINWEKGSVTDVIDLMLTNRCTITYSSSNAFGNFIISMYSLLCRDIAIFDCMDALNFACKEYDKQIKLMKENKMEE